MFYTHTGRKTNGADVLPLHKERFGFLPLGHFHNGVNQTVTYDTVGGILNLFAASTLCTRTLGIAENANVEAASASPHEFIQTNIFS